VTRQALPLHNPDDLLRAFAAGSERALARAISLAQLRSAAARDLVAALGPPPRAAVVIGVTGSAGAGKSTLVEKIALEQRARGRRVAILAVDPSSPFTGGAVLGDRVRMGEALRDEGVYMRSLANQGALGGLAAVCDDAVWLCARFGFDRIVVETVGAGQSEVDIMRIATTVLIAVAPGLGDQVQAVKAGLLEVGDLFVVTKCDREDATRVASDLEAVIEISHPGRPGLNRWTAASGAIPPAVSPHLAARFGRPVAGHCSWRPPVLRTSAVHGTGVAAVVDALDAHGDFLVDSGLARERALARASDRLRAAVACEAASEAWASAQARADFAAIARDLAAGRIDVQSAVARLRAPAAASAAAPPVPPRAARHSRKGLFTPR
jgi:LAO/AO transport system kinase